MGASIFSITATDSGGCSSSRTYTITVLGDTGCLRGYSGPAVAIPDADPTGVNVPINVTGAGTVYQLIFNFDTGGACDSTVGNPNAAVDHTYIGDLVFKLTSPSGTSVIFQNQRGGTRENICSSKLVDNGGFPSISTLTSVSGSPQSGNFTPDNPLSAFNGQSSTGTWILNVSDLAAQDTGSIRRFSLNFNPGSTCMPTTTTPTATPTATATPTGRTLFDYDGDRKTDVSVYRPSNGLWYLQRSLAGETVIQLGNATDKIAPADFDGDGKTDLAVYRQSQGAWYVFNSSTQVVSVSNFGIAEDLPAPGDYDGDGKADIAIYRPSTGQWWLNRTTAGLIAIQFGLTGDVPVPGDFDGDGKNDLVVFRPSNGIWYMQRSTAGGFAIQFGNSTDKIAPADYDGDGKMDVGIYRPSQGTWYSYNSSNGSYPVTVFGLSTDIPTPGDYDGDGKADIAIFRPSNGQWWLNRTTSGLTVVQFGSNGDKPTQSAFSN